MISTPKWMIAAVFSVVSAIPAAAQQAADWSGFYAGVFAGDHAAQTRFDDGIFFTPDFDVNGTVVGVLAGYNFQRGNVVFGVEGDIAALDVSGIFGPLPCGSVSCVTTLDQLMTLRGRIGVAHGNGLFYATVGAATVMGSAQYSGTDDFERTATVYGLGAELMVQDVWSVRFEALLFDSFGTEPQAVLGGGGPLNVRLDDASQIRLGVIRRF